MPESINIKVPIHITLEKTRRTWLGCGSLITMGRMRKIDGESDAGEREKQDKNTKGLIEGKKGFTPSSLKRPSNS